MLNKFAHLNFKTYFKENKKSETTIKKNQHNLFCCPYLLSSSKFKIGEK